MPLKPLVTNQHPNDETPIRPPSTRQQFLKCSLALLAALSMISKPKATALVNAVILYHGHPSIFHLMEVFFTTGALLYAMALGGYGAWAFLSNLQGQGRARIESSEQQRGKIAKS